MLAPVSRSKSHSTSVWAEVRTRSREMTGEIARGSVRKATPERSSVVAKMLRRLLTTAPPKVWSREGLLGHPPGDEVFRRTAGNRSGLVGGGLLHDLFRRVGAGVVSGVEGRVEARRIGNLLRGARAAGFGRGSPRPAVKTLRHSVLDLVGVGDDVDRVEAEHAGEVVRCPWSAGRSPRARPYGEARRQRIAQNAQAG